MRDLPAVVENVERPEKLSQTFLSHTDNCARAGFLYLRHRDSVSSHPMDRGTAGHECVRRFIELLVEKNEPTGPSEVIKDLLDGVFADFPDLQVPTDERDKLRMMLYHFAEGIYIEPDTVVAVEKAFEIPIAGTVVRGKLDFASINAAVRHANVRDWKFRFAPPRSEDDDFGATFQGKLYGLSLIEGKGEDDPVPVGKDVDTVKIEEVYLGNKDLPTREAIYTRQELHDFKQDLEAVIAKAEHGFDSGKWQAVPGHHCGICPAAHECPLPPELIPVSNDGLGREELAERWYWLTTEASRIKNKILRPDAERNGPIPIGKDLELAFSVSKPGQKVSDIEAVKALIENGGGDISDYIETTKPSVRFDKRRVKA